MDILPVPQIFIFAGLNAAAVEFLTINGRWLPFTEDTDSAGGILIDKDEYSDEQPHKAIVGVYSYDKMLITRVYKTIQLENDPKKTYTLYKYQLSDESWVWESVDRIVADERPALCLLDESGNTHFRWSNEEIEEAITFMLNEDLID